ncbi:MAG: signal peptide peptidase SppA [Bacteroidales bacterium]|nr:signal peptide peptidase SppA [Bacteroidales bacterium]
MMKRFIASMLGSLAAIWISVILLSALFLLFIGAIFSESFLKRVAQVNLQGNSILHIELNGKIEERQDGSPILGKLIGITDESQGLNDIVAAISHAETDSRIKGIYLDCKDIKAGLASLDYIRESLLKFKSSGKWIIAYGDNLSQGDYFVASIADMVSLNPVGLLDIHGLSATTLYFKGLLDKLGIEMQVIKVGTYKSAVEPFILSAPSEPSRRQQQQFLDTMWDDISAKIASARKMSAADISSIADSLILTHAPETYVSARLIDTLMYRHSVEELLKTKTGIKKTDDLHLITPAEYCMAVEPTKTDHSPNQIAVLYACGDIVDDGEGGIVASQIVPQIYSIIGDYEIDGLVLRVNSGGGSAFASEQIWEALEQFKATGRPFYVSMGDYAASGGYYISCGADLIYADALTLTGSIGIFGLIPCAKDLMNDHLGITTATVATNTAGQLPEISAPLTQFQKARLQQTVDRGYETFVSRCAAGRNMSVDSIKVIAEGRVWDAITAQQIGLVDKIGSLKDAVSAMAAHLNFRTNEYTIVDYTNNSFDKFRLFSILKSRLSSGILNSELGDNLWIYESMQSLQRLSPIQSRMEDILIY